MKTIKVTGYVFALVGVALYFLAGGFYQDTKAFLATANKTDGMVIDYVTVEYHDSSSNTYKPVVEFMTAEGELITFTTSSATNPPAYDIGEPVEVVYLETYPEDAKINSLFSVWFGAIFAFSLASIFFIIGVAIIGVPILQQRRGGYLKEHGMRVTAQVTGVSLNKSLQVNGLNPYKIFAKWKHNITGKDYEFASKNLWSDPTEHIMSNEVTVYIDKENPKKYYMDTSFMPK